jgi:hypothetical protein
MDLVRIRALGIPDGEHLLPSGGSVVVEEGVVVELQAPLRPDPDGHGTTVQWVTTAEAGALIGCPIFAGLWRVAGGAYVAEWPVRAPSESAAYSAY